MQSSPRRQGKAGRPPSQPPAKAAKSMLPSAATAVRPCCRRCCRRHLQHLQKTTVAPTPTVVCTGWILQLSLLRVLLLLLLPTGYAVRWQRDTRFFYTGILSAVEQLSQRLPSTPCALSQHLVTRLYHGAMSVTRCCKILVPTSPTSAAAVACACASAKGSEGPRGRVNQI